MSCADVAKRDRYIFMIGDSTMANKSSDKYPETGWGQVFNEFFTEGIKIENLARNGRSTKSFLAENRWTPSVNELNEGDYVFIEFGHNDEKTTVPEVGTSLEEYRANLLRFVKETRSKKAIPVLLTPIARRSFKNGVYYDTHGLYPSVVVSLAKSEDVPLIDLHDKSEQLLKEMGDESSKELFLWAEASKYSGYPEGIRDNTHLNPTGARVIAKLAADGIKELDLPLAANLK